MNAITLYITTCRYVIQSNPQDPETWEELYRYLPYLRQALSCCVCTHVFHCPMGPVETKCQHHVCKECVGGKMRLKPACGWCNNFDEFIEKPQLRIVVQCFKKLCEYIASSAIALHLASSCTNLVGAVSGNHLLTIIQEAVSIKDDFAFVPSSKCNLLPPPKLQKFDTAGVTNVSQVPPISSADRARRFKRKRRSRFGRLRIAPPTLNKELEKETEKVENGKADINLCEKSEELPQKETNGHNNSFISDTVKAEHDYIKEMPQEVEEKSTVMAKPESRIASGPETVVTVDLKKKKKKTEIHSKFTVGSSELKLNNSEKVCDTVKNKVQNKGNRSQNYGCRCGLATPKPGNLTCCGQRCPCYSAFRGCEGCKCRGCRNPRGDPATNPLAAMRLQKQLQNVHVNQTPISHLGGIDINTPFLSVSSDLVDDELDINIDI